MAFSTKNATTESLKIHVMPKDIYDEIDRAGGIRENELYLVEGGTNIGEDEPVSLSDGGTGVRVNSVAELRSALSVAAADHTSTDVSCGIGTGLKFGHVRLTDDINLTSDATQGVAVTPKALNTVYKVVEDLASSMEDINSSNTITSTLTGYAEIAEWSDGNKTDEDRIGYFVTTDITKQSINIVKANPTSSVRGVTVSKPGFTANSGSFKYDTEGNLLPRYSYIVNQGIVTVIDDGSCVAGGKCIPNYSGIATPSTNDMGYYVISRIDTDRILIYIEPQINTLVNLKNDVDNKQNTLTWTTIDDIDAMIAGTYDPDTVGDGEIGDDDNMLLYLVREE